ncbi:MAG: hypothetical protein HC788_10465, partial [Sphingopyxis sp.]|nr:hypothetical protein [Sphingopyxis sp.]
MTTILSARSNEILVALRNMVLPTLYSDAPWAERQEKILGLFRQGDEFDPTVFATEREFLAELLDGRHPSSTSDEGRIRRGKIKTIIEEAIGHRSSLILKHEDGSTSFSEDLVKFSHFVRMELSRHERESDILLAVDFELERLNALRLSLASLLPAYNQHMSTTNDVIKIQEYPSVIFERELKEFFEKFEKSISESISIWSSMRDVYKTNIEETNDGIHRFTMDDEKGGRPGVGVETEIIRHLQVLTKLWVQFVDPKLRLPARDNDAENCYSRAMMAALEFAGHFHVRSQQVIDRAYRV